MDKDFTYMKKLFLILTCIFVIFGSAFAEILNSPTWGYSVDLPEEFVLVDKNGADSYMFENAFISSSVIIKAYKKDRFSSSLEAMETVMNQLGAEFECAESEWRNTDCIVSQFAFNLGGISNTGWAVSSLLQDSKGYVVMLCYSPTEVFYDLEQFIISCVDSLCIDYGSYYSPGPITSFAFPKGETENHSIEIDGEKINFTLDSSDIEAEKFVIEREYAVLCLYQDSEMWIEAWQRYYRQVYKNAYSRLSKAAFNIYNKLIKNCNSENADVEMAQKLLSWTQSFNYQRDFTSADFTPITAAITGTGSDCDSRAMLLACLLHHMNYDTCLFVSAELVMHFLESFWIRLGQKSTLMEDSFCLGKPQPKLILALFLQV